MSDTTEQIVADLSLIVEGRGRRWVCERCGIGYGGYEHLEAAQAAGVSHMRYAHQDLDVIHLLLQTPEGAGRVIGSQIVSPSDDTHWLRVDRPGDYLVYRILDDSDWDPAQDWAEDAYDHDYEAWE